MSLAIPVLDNPISEISLIEASLNYMAPMADRAVYYTYEPSIKCFDSAEDGPARFAAHTGFDDPTSPPNAPARQSIELRTLVFY